ncbi:MAG: GlsB/YeaQ/YmgE family stress response membrane protein [Crenarchaeota archaeon]|nr:MAG: GlsB/YeaQ/YmgE family stress response membrane protein [Thermoproteota archaeon]
MIYLLWFLCFGLASGFVVKSLRPGEGFTKWSSILILGIVGSFIGGAINWLISGGQLSPAGFLMSILGGIIFCEIYRKYKLDRWIELQKEKPKVQSVFDQLKKWYLALVKRDKK